MGLPVWNTLACELSIGRSPLDRLFGTIGVLYASLVYPCFEP